MCCNQFELMFIHLLKFFFVNKSIILAINWSIRKIDEVFHYIMKKKMFILNIYHKRLLLHWKSTPFGEFLYNFMHSFQLHSNLYSYYCHALSLFFQVVRSFCVLIINDSKQNLWKGSGKKIYNRRFVIHDPVMK